MLSNVIHKLEQQFVVGSLITSSAWSTWQRLQLPALLLGLRQKHTRSDMARHCATC